MGNRLKQSLVVCRLLLLKGLGKSYGRLSLYLCPFWPLLSKDKNIIEDSNFASSESEFDEIGDIESGEIPGSAVTGGPSISGSLTNSGLDGPAIKIVDTDDETHYKQICFLKIHSLPLIFCEYRFVKAQTF